MISGVQVWFMVATAGEADSVEVTFSRYTATYPANTAASFSNYSL